MITKNQPHKNYVVVFFMNILQCYVKYSIIDIGDFE